MTTEELHEASRSHYTVASRTTRRDLFNLRDDKRVELCDGAQGRAHHWTIGGKSLQLELTPTDAITLTAIFHHADRFGFKSSVEQLGVLRTYAEARIRAHAKRDLVGEGRITTNTRFTVLQPGAHVPAHLTLIQEALLGDRSLKVVYRPRDNLEATCTYRLQPLALSWQDSNIYLSALVVSEQWSDGRDPHGAFPRGKYSSNGPGKTCALMLHRMLEVTDDWLQVDQPPGYRVDDLQVQKDLITVHSDKPIGLALRLMPNLLNRLRENPLDPDQQLAEHDIGWLLQCQILDTQGLRLFLLSNAAEIEVLAPAYLRDHVRETLRAAVAMYDNHNVEP
ncbi:WYL domain-containing protein [Pseudomonas sp. RIT-To-2]|uniref:WYL domain-containing protein n=1 Tax=Pseudomonas sp. RIT-To-2 TaxID=3462541 RepID=UPI002412F3F2